MEHDFFSDQRFENALNAPRTHYEVPPKDSIHLNLSKSPGRTKEDFMQFCADVLAYTNFVPDSEKEGTVSRGSTSPMDSSGTHADSYESPCSDGGRLAVLPHSTNGPPDEDYNLVTCFCNKPFARRPMIECCECFVWLHLSCAKIRINNIPDDFVCQKCRDAKVTVRKSQRVRTESKRLTITSD